MKKKNENIYWCKWNSGIFDGFFSDELTIKAIEKFMNKFKIKISDMWPILCIYKRTKIKLDKTLAQNGLEDQSHIILIFAVHYWYTILFINNKLKNIFLKNKVIGSKIVNCWLFINC